MDPTIANKRKKEKKSGSFYRCFNISMTGCSNLW